MTQSKFSTPLNSQIKVTVPWDDFPSDSSIVTIPLTDIYLPKGQPRRYFDEEALARLEKSIQEHGILQPLIVRKGDSDKYELVAGERRLKVAIKLDLAEAPVVIKDLSDEEAFEIALIENLHREELNPVEEVEGVLQLLAHKVKCPTEEVSSLLYRLQNEDKGKVTRNVAGKDTRDKVEEVFTLIGKFTRHSFVRHHLPLLKLPKDVLDALQEGEIAYTKAVAISKVSNNEQRSSLLQESISQKLSLSEIKNRIKALNQETSENDTPNKRFSDFCKRLNKKSKKSSVWDDDQKWARAQELMIELESLL